MKVIRRGKPPEEREHEITCQRCNSVLRFKDHEATVAWQGDQREPGYKEIVCPVCTARLLLPL